MFFRKYKKNADFSAFFVGIISWGFRRGTPTQRTFREKSFGISKASPKQIGEFGGKFLRIFKGLFTKSPLKQGPLTAVPTYYDKLKNAAMPRFLSALSVGASAPNPDTKDFS